MRDMGSVERPAGPDVRMSPQPRPVLFRVALRSVCLHDLAIVIRVPVVNRRLSHILAALLAGTLGAGPASAQESAIEQRASGVLTLFGLAAVPSETASTLFLDTGQNGGTGTDFRSWQLGGGFTVSDTFPLYLEGYLGWNRYDPVFIFSDGAQRRRVPAHWNSLAASGAVGWDFDLTGSLVLRPMALLALGTVASDVAVGSALLNRRFDTEIEFLKDGSLTAGGLGAALALAYNRRWDNDWEADLTLRHTRLHLRPVGGDKDVVGEAQAFTTGLWSRLRVPTGYRAFDRPVRLVGEFSMGHYGGDQEEIFRTPWLAQVGFGGEIDVSRTGIPWVTTARLVARYTTGENVEGFSVGLAVSF
jgi:hypothetical protein